MTHERSEVIFVPIRRAAARLGVPLAYLRREVEENRLPAVRAGRRWLVPMPRAAELLAERAELAAREGVAHVK